MAVEENLNLHVVQTVNLLAVVDYTGKYKSYTRIHLKLSNCILHLMI